MIMDSPKKKGTGVPFQTRSKDTSKALPGTSKEVKVVLTKINATLLQTPSRKEIEVIDISSSPSPTGENTLPPLSIQPSSSGKKRKIETIVSPSGIKKAKPMKTVNKSSNAKTTKVSRDKTSFQKVSRSQAPLNSVPVETCSASHCNDCVKKDENIGLLKDKIKKLEDKDSYSQRRLTIYEGLGLSHLMREEENKALLKKRGEVQLELVKAEQELQNYIQEEDAEVKRLLQERKTLKKNLSEKTDENEKLDALEEADLKHIKESTEEFKKNEDKNTIERNALKAQNDILKEKVAEMEKKFGPPPKEVPPVEPEQGPCDFCQKLPDKIREMRKKLKAVEVETPIVRKELEDSIENVSNGFADVEYMKYVIEYLKTRIMNERKSHSCDENKRELACWEDFHYREVFTENVCELMDKNLRSKYYNPTPVTLGLPNSERELNMLEFLEEGTSMCCLRLKPEWCRRYLCGRNKRAYSKDERLQYETSHGANYCARNPGLIETEEGKRIYLSLRADALIRQHRLNTNG